MIRTILPPRFLVGLNPDKRTILLRADDELRAFQSAADTEPAPGPCVHHVLSGDGSYCVSCGDDQTLEVDAETVAEAIRGLW